MGPLFQDVTLEGWLSEIINLLFLVAHWLLESGMGPTILLVTLVLLVLAAVSAIHGNVKADDSFNIRSDAKAMADWYKERV